VTKYLLFLAPLFAAAALAVGCGGSEASDTETASQPAPAAQTAEATPTAAAEAPELPTEDTNTEEPAAEAAAEVTEVKMAGSTFAPGTIDMKVGETVKFVNDDEIAHTATADAFDSGTLDPGASFEFTADKAGSISYLCEFHPGMTGTINVT
jgi:plastocyanin